MYIDGREGTYSITLGAATGPDCYGICQAYVNQECVQRLRISRNIANKQCMDAYESHIYIYKVSRLRVLVLEDATCNLTVGGVAL